MAKYKEMIPEGMSRPKPAGKNTGNILVEVSLRQSPQVIKKELHRTLTDGGLFIDTGSANLSDISSKDQTPEDSFAGLRARLWASLPEDVRLRAEQYRR